MRSLRAFTLIELLVVITIIGILAAIALPNYIKAKDKAKEVQTKSAIKSIQVAVERYHTDFEQYPQYLLGGDTEGWKNWHSRHDEENPIVGDPQNAWLKDILIEYNYLDAYPINPFVDNGNAIIQQTGPLTPGPNGYEPGQGDPRFGFRGDTMGNGCEVPIMFRNWYNNTDLNIETERTLLSSTGGDPTTKGFGTPMTGGLHYTMGGRRALVNTNGNQEVGQVYTHWPGNFFYRGVGQHWKSRKGWTIYVPTTFVKAEVARYMIGGYGSYTTEGQDIIRLERESSTG
ncbi:MAG TPA: type II secretion system protein, partial [bacterium]|nr:type II secretion system protein [bacterium]